MWTVFNKPSEESDFTAGVYKSKHGFKIHLDPKQYIDKFIYYWGEWEPNETYTVMSLLNKGDIFIDIGANIGYFSLLAGNIVGRGGKVYSFEPVPATNEVLQKNASINNFSNIKIFRYAAVDNNRAIKIARRGKGDRSELNSMRPLDTEGEYWSIEGKRVDEIVPSNLPIRLIKLDVEGAEFFALKGLEKILRLNNAPMVLCEVTDSFLRELGSSAKELYQFMLDCGYKHTYRSSNKSLNLIRTVNLNVFQENILFTKIEINPRDSVT